MVVISLKTSANGTLHAGLPCTHALHIYSWMYTN